MSKPWNELTDSEKGRVVFGLTAIFGFIMTFLSPFFALLDGWAGMLAFLVGIFTIALSIIAIPRNDLKE